MPNSKSERAARLAAALRDNLKRRKAQARAAEGRNDQRHADRDAASTLGLATEPGSAVDPAASSG